MKTSNLLSCSTALALVFSASQAVAQNIDVTLIDVVPGQETWGTVTGDSGFQMWRPGVINFTNNTYPGLDFQAFCVEPEIGLNYDDAVTYAVQDIATLTNHGLVASLVGGYLSHASSGEDEVAAAFQWAIWEVLRESSTFNLLDGNVRLENTLDYPGSEAIASLGNVFLSNAQNDIYTPVTLTYLVSSNGQNLVTWQTIPEPSVAGLAVLSSFFFLRRRR